MQLCGSKVQKEQKKGGGGEEESAPHIRKIHSLDQVSWKTLVLHQKTAIGRIYPESHRFSHSKDLGKREEQEQDNE